VSYDYVEFIIIIIIIIIIICVCVLLLLLMFMCLCSIIIIIIIIINVWCASESSPTKFCTNLVFELHAKSTVAILIQQT
jgi:hypothetical protein